MKIDRSTEVKPVAEERVLMDESFRPLWMFIRYNGILPDFLDHENVNRLFFIARFLVTSFIAGTILIYTAFELFELVVEIPKTNDKTKTVFVLLYFLFGLFGLICLHQCVLYQKEFVQFFKDWKNFEIQSLEYFHGIKNRKRIKVLYFVYAMILAKILLIGFFWNLMQPNIPAFLSHSSFLRNKLGIPLLIFITVIFAYFSHVFSFLGEITPTVFYYHAGCIIEDLDRGLKHISEEVYFKSLDLKQSDTSFDATLIISNLNLQFQTVRPFRNVWEKYETIFDWVQRANKLFAILILSGYSAVFIFSATSIYMALKNLTESYMLALGFFSLFICSCLRTLFMNRLMSHLVISCGKLKSTVAELLSRKWTLLSEEDRLLLASFRSRLDTEVLAASPFDLYSVNPSNLLTMLSLIVTYTIVLLQF